MHTLHLFSYWYDCMHFMYTYVDLSILLSCELMCALFYTYSEYR